MSATPTNRAELVKLIGRRACANWGIQFQDGSYWDQLAAGAVNIIAAAGFVVVPVEPTPATIAAARAVVRDDLDPTDDKLAALYRAMVAAAWKEGA